MPWRTRPYDGDFCGCEVPGEKCSYCQGYENYWEDDPKPFVRHPANQCLFLKDRYQVEYIVKQVTKELPSIVEFQGVIYFKQDGRNYVEIEMFDDYEEVDEAY